MVEVGVMRVLVLQRRMVMQVRMRLCICDFGVMIMFVMFVVDVAMVMANGIVFMFMNMPL